MRLQPGILAAVPAVALLLCACAGPSHAPTAAASNGAASTSAAVSSSASAAPANPAQAAADAGSFTVKNNGWAAGPLGMVIAGGGPEYMVLTSGTDWTNYTLSMDFAIVHQAIGILFRAATSGPPNLYMWYIDANHPYGTNCEPCVREHDRVNGAWNVFRRVSLPPGFGIHDWHHAQIIVNGDRYSFYLDGYLVDSSVDPHHTHGSVGFREYSPEEAIVRNYTVTAPGGTVLFAAKTFQHHIQDFAAPAATATG